MCVARAGRGRYLGRAVKKADSLRMPEASLASLAALAACRASAAFCLAASLGSKRALFSEGCTATGGATQGGRGGVGGCVCVVCVVVVVVVVVG